MEKTEKQQEDREKPENSTRIKNESQPRDPPDYLFRIKADGNWEIPQNVNPYILPTLLRRAANQLEKRLTEAP